MKHAMFLLFGLALAGCGVNEEVPYGQAVEGRLVPHLTTDSMCSYMFPDGSIAEYARYSSAPCPEHQIDVLEAE